MTVRIMVGDALSQSGDAARRVGSLRGDVAAVLGSPSARWSLFTPPRCVPLCSAVDSRLQTDHAGVALVRIGKGRRRGADAHRRDRDRWTR